MTRLLRVLMLVLVGVSLGACSSPEQEQAATSAPADSVSVTVEAIGNAIAVRVRIAGFLLVHGALGVRVERVVLEQGLRVHADHAVDDELEARQSDAAMRNAREIKGAIRRSS